jgi:DNA adenine methylase
MRLRPIRAHVTIAEVRSPLKWAGGKRQLLGALRPWFPLQFSRYFEPFLGSGAVFFDLVSSGRLDGRPAQLTDVNADLIGCYSMLRDRTEEVIEVLARLARRHKREGSRLYYAIRDGQFNPARAAGAPPTPELAGMFIYLNRTGFNGLYRLNRQGGFNVPAGRYLDPRICDAVHLRAVADVLRRPGVTIEHAPFSKALDAAGDGDFVYCDPPYAPLSATASFAHYTAGGFSARDQLLLQQHVLGAVRRGATVVLSNSSAPLILDLYGGADAREAGLMVRRVPARRAISANAARRGPVEEVVVTNAASAAAAVPKPKMLRARLRSSVRRRA